MHFLLQLLQFSIYVRSTSNVEFKRQRLKKIYSDYFSQPGANSFYAQLVANYINLLGKKFAHVQLEPSNKKVKPSAEFQVSEQHAPNAGSILDRSVLETLHYACGRYKWGDTAAATLQSPASPFKLAEAHAVGAPQFEWIALNERARANAWLDFEHIFERKAWLNLKQRKSFTIHIPIDRTILRLAALAAPEPVLNNFLAKVDDPARRLGLARRVGAKKGVVDALVALKDRPELELFRDGLEAGTEERFYAENALKSLVSRFG